MPFETLKNPAISVADAKAIFVGQTRIKSGVFVPSDWGQFWRPARDGAKSSIAVICDSIGHGFFTSSLRNNAWPQLMRSELQTAKGDGGVGFLGISDTDVMNVGAQYDSYRSTAEWVAATGTWQNPTLYEGPGGRVIQSPSSGNGSLTWQNVRGTTVRVYFLGNSSSGTFTWTIDGVAQSNGVTGGAGNRIAYIEATGLAAGNHTVVLSTTTSNVYIAGVSGENTTGVTLNMFGQAGYDSNVFVSNPGSYGGNIQWSGGADYPANLLIYSLFANDLKGNRTGDAWAQNAAKMIGGVKNNSTIKGAIDVLIVIPAIGPSWSTNKLLQDYAIRARALCEHYGAALIDLNALYRGSWDYAHDLSVWSTGTGNSGAAGTDQVHPGDVGAVDYWAKIKAALPEILT